MEIVEHAPGRKLIVAETAPRVPLWVLLSGLVLVILVAAPWRWLWSTIHGVDRGAGDLMASGIWLVIGLLLLSGLLRGRRLERMSVDRDSGRVEWNFSHFAGIPGFRRHVDLAALEALKVELMPDSRGAVKREAKGGLPLRLTFPRERGQAVRLDLRIPAVDRVSEIAAFGMRLGASAGFPHYRVTGNDAEQFAIELLPAAGRDTRVVPDPSAPDSARDAAEAAIAEERIPPFEPKTYEGSPGVARWAPGREVRFEKSWGPAILLAPLLLAALAGPLAWLRLPGISVLPLLPRIAALGLITFSGLGVAAIGWAGLSTSLPKSVTLDWASRSLIVHGVREQRTMPFSEISAIELFTRTYRGRVGTMQHYMSYCCEVRAVPSGASAPLLLTETRSYREDSVTPRRMALPLVAELASALGVERRTG